MSFLNDLCTDLLVLVATHLPPIDAFRLQLVSKKWLTALRHERVWQKHGASSFDDFCARARELTPRKHCHIFFYLRISLDELEKNGVPGNLRRVTNELLSIHLDPCGWRVEPARDNFQNWHANTVGPAGTPYEGAKLSLDIHFPDDYPFRPPRVRISPIWHVNVTFPEGMLCIGGLLRDHWSPALQMRHILLEIFSMLHMQNTDSPLNLKACEQYLRSVEEFDAAAKAHAGECGKEYLYRIDENFFY